MNPYTDLKTGLTVFRGEMSPVGTRPPISYKSGNWSPCLDLRIILKTIPALSIRKSLMAFAFLVRDN
jgi:lipopolysaccharide/colanic/teichoic acid biosynthesis glycosyltransferase